VQKELMEIVERAKADGMDMVGLSISYQIRGRTYQLLAKYLTDNEGDIAENVPEFLGMGSVYMAIDEIEHIAEDMLSIAKYCLMIK